MTPETKFRELERRAMVHLMRPLDARKVVEINRASLIVLIWRHPAFEPYQSWSLINGKAVREERWFVRRTTWEHSTDYARRGFAA